MKSLRSVFIGQHKGFDRHANGLFEEGEEVLPVKQGMRHRYDRYWGTAEPRLSLAPLRRLAASLVGQNWDKARSELIHSFGRDFKGRQALEWVEREISLNTHMVDGRVFVGCDFYGLVPIEKHYNRLYVHPETRMICKVPSGAKKIVRKVEPVTRVTLDDMTQLHLVNDIWYAVTLESLESAKASGVAAKYFRYAPHVRDRVTGKKLNYVSLYDLRSLYGRDGVFAATKRQLSHKELVKYQLLGPAQKLAA